MSREVLVADMVNGIEEELGCMSSPWRTSFTAAGWITFRAAEANQCVGAESSTTTGSQGPRAMAQI